MLFNIKKSILLLSLSNLLNFVVANDDEVRFITSDGVVYSYAVITSTIKPATVIVRTSSYTTTRVREITLDNSEVTSTTEEITTQSTIVSSVHVTPVTSDTKAESTSVVPSPSYTTNDVVSTTSAQHTQQIVQDDNVEGKTTSTLEPSSTPAATSSETETESSSSSTSIVFPTITSDSGTCYVYFDDPNDEYYSTAYITDATQSVDAATTLTSTKTVYATMTI